jgi:hypothetical protein
MRIPLLLLVLSLLVNGCSGSTVAPDQGLNDAMADVAPDDGALDADMNGLDFPPPLDLTTDATDAAMPGYLDTPCVAANGCQGAYECLIDDVAGDSWCALACISNSDCGDGCCRGPAGGNTYCYPPRHCQMTP